jgi:gliding motility-associated-like protein
MSNLLKILLLNIFLLMGFFSHCQIIGPNLVQNPSFEEHDTCPIMSGELYKSKYWWGYSTEYYIFCNTGLNQLSVPLNYNGFQYAKSGIAYAGFLLNFHPRGSTSQIMESIKSILSDSLKRQTRYCINYYISLADLTIIRAYNESSIITYDSIGIMFTSNQVQDNSSPTICDTCSKYIKSVVGIDTSNWMKISGNIIAKGGEKYLIIGKFNTMNWDPNLYYNFYVYIDDVSVCECSFDINLGADTALCESETIILMPNLPNATYTWQDSSHAATYEVKQPGTYWVRAYVADYDITTTDTIVITAGDDSFCNPPLTIPNVITPNGDSQNDNFVLPNAENYDIALQIYNRWGTLIYETASYQNDFSCKECADGVYYYVLKAKSKRNGREKEYKGSLTIING